MTLECTVGLKRAIREVEAHYLRALDNRKEDDARQFGAELEALQDVWEAQQLYRKWTIPENLMARPIHPSGDAHVH
jgi:hypothetical protein